MSPTSQLREALPMLAREKWQIGTIAVLEEVFQERLRQVAKYGHNDELEDGTGPGVEWLHPVVTVDQLPATRIEKEFRRGYEEFEKKTGNPTWMHLVREEIAESFLETDPKLLSEELTQVAALCVSWIEKLKK